MTHAPTLPDLARTWGFWGIVLGTLGVLCVFLPIAIEQATPEPAGSAAAKIGEIAGEMKRAAWRSFFGLSQPEIAPPPPPSMMARSLGMMGIAAPVLGALAILLSMVSFVTRENRTLATYAVCLGGGALLAQFLWWALLLVCGIILLVTIIQNLGEFFSFG
jgi:hypothetical protein